MHVTSEEVDNDGNTYLLYDGNNSDIGTMYIYQDGGTAADYTDDILLTSFAAKNKTTTSSNGKWPDGIYDMIDTKKPYKHGNRKRRGVLVDSDNGSYGSGGIFRANPFFNPNYRNGMGVHAGRENQNWLTGRKTEGCIRVPPGGFEAIIAAIEIYGQLTRIIVQNNRLSSWSNSVNSISPKNIPNVGWSEMINSPNFVTHNWGW